MPFGIQPLINQIRATSQQSADRFSVAHGAARLKSDELTDRMPIMGEVRMIGGALVMILLIVYILNEVYNSINLETDADGNYEGPFGSVVGDLETIGVAALGLLVLALLVIAAQAIMRFFGSSGFGGGR